MSHAIRRMIACLYEGEREYEETAWMRIGTRNTQDEPDSRQLEFMLREHYDWPRSAASPNRVAAERRFRLSSCE